ncbi:hypothetical protein BDP27DRAFT_58303 [Rhodocollybia butyracea]|uniref:Uncharacterized protein n=1 Tax=Rhodocollybia butyracea TaxID=206335 RepID=A0A9P5PGR5_9AGAR|nr:hypothetical protein BDP27DRAFT_58303 [Rhodocollybia butyracea]
MTSNVPTVPAMPSLQCTSCTRLKSGRDSLQLLVADCQRKLLDSQRELLEERIEKQQMQNELGDLQVELEVIMTELALYRSRATAGDKTARESKDCQTDAVPSEPVGTLTLAAQERTKITKYRDGTGQLSLIDLSSSSQSRSSSSSRGRLYHVVLLRRLNSLNQRSSWAQTPISNGLSHLSSNAGRRRLI